MKSLNEHLLEFSNLELLLSPVHKEYYEALKPHGFHIFSQSKKKVSSITVVNHQTGLMFDIIDKKSKVNTYKHSLGTKQKTDFYSGNSSSVFVKKAVASNNRIHKIGGYINSHCGHNKTLRPIKEVVDLTKIFVEHLGTEPWQITPWINPLSSMGDRIERFDSLMERRQSVAELRSLLNISKLEPLIVPFNYADTYVNDFIDICLKYPLANVIIETDKKGYREGDGASEFTYQLEAIVNEAKVDF
jgi:hypothetical protein